MTQANLTFEIIEASYLTQRVSLDITNELRGKVSSNRLEVRASNAIKGDPDPNVVKSLSITYKVGDSVIKKVFKEGDQISIPSKEDVASITVSSTTVVSTTVVSTTVTPATTTPAPATTPSAATPTPTDALSKQITEPYKEKVTKQTNSKIAAAYTKGQAKKNITCREFFTERTGSHSVSAQKLINALDETELWENVLFDEGLLENPEVAAEVVRRQQAWIEDETSPTKQMIVDLLETPWAEKPMKEFAEYLKSKDNDQVTQVIDNWISKVDGKAISAQKAGIKRFETAKTLNQFFMSLVGDDHVFTKEMIPSLVGKLQADHITNVKLLGRLKDEQLEKYGLKIGQVILIRDALEDLD